MADVSDATEFNAALANTNITKITLTGAITTGTINTIDRSIEIDLAGFNINPTLTYNHNKGGTSKITTSTGTATVTQVDVNTPAASFIQGSSVTITTLNLFDTKDKTYTNNGTIGTATITDNDARFLNEGTVDDVVLNNAAGNVTLGGNSPIAKVTVTNAESLNVAPGTNINNLEANGATTVNNQGILDNITGSSPVVVNGSGTVKKATNTSVTTPIAGEADQSVVKSTGEDLVQAGDVYSASFNWSSKNGVGTKLVEKSGRYNYYNDGAYLDITVKNTEDTNLAFESVFKDMTLITDDGNTDSIKGTAGRQQEDWKGTDGIWKTKLKTADSKAVFYGVRQTGTGTTLGTTRTVGFNAGDSRKIDLALTPLENLAAGTYTITVQPKQQTNETSGTNLGNAITYTIVIPTGK